MNSSKKVIITGASGLIGKEALEPLQQAGFDIYALTIDDQDAWTHGCMDARQRQITRIPCNLFDEKTLQNVFKEIKPSYLLNFAWATTGDYLTSGINFDFLKAGLNLLKCFSENNGKRAVFAGTCFEYKFKDTSLKETDEINPQTVYAKCKNYLRELAQLYCEQNGISFGWGRIFYVYGHGENEKRLTSQIIKSIKNRKEVIITNGNLVKDYIYSKDIAGGFVKFLDGDVTGIVNICTGKGITLADYAMTIANKFSRPDLIKILNEPTTQPPVIVGDNTRLIREAGYKIQYSIDMAIDNILRNQIFKNDNNT
ncbi:MAG: NAD-dependent epimerase/dehydratase family protein, partial [Endomicrobia bacterium]|nr:NAD-dependent epimerase/dehydratase family protein [Endomicrobiia bacterium]